MTVVHYAPRRQIAMYSHGRNVLADSNRIRPHRPLRWHLVKKMEGVVMSSRNRLSISKADPMVW